MKKLSLSFALVLLFVLAFLATDIQAQSTPIAGDPTAQNFVRIDIGNNGLHCPFLGPRLKRAVEEMEGTSNLVFNDKESFLTFEISVENTPNEEKIAGLAIDAGYPPDDVAVSIKSREIKSGESGSSN